MKVNSRSKTQSALGCIAAACALPGIASSQNATEQVFEWSLSTGGRYSDNIARTPVNEESTTLGVAGIAFQINTERPRASADIGANVEYRDYLDGVFENEVAGGLSGVVSYAFIPERFIWIAADNFGQIATERQRVETPQNRQNINYFTTGPDIRFDFGGRTALQLSGRFSDSYYQRTPEDNQSITGSLALIRQLSETLSGSLNASNTTVEYQQDDLFGDYEISEQFVRLAAASSRTALTVDLGYTGVDQAGESSNGSLARIDLTRDVAARSRIGLHLGSGFSTASEIFRRDQTITGVQTGNDDAIASSDAVQSDFAYLSWRTSWERSAVDAVLSARDEAHETVSALDRELYSAALTLARQLSRRLDAELFGGYSEEEFVSTAFRFDEWSAGVGLNWRLAERISLRLRLDHLQGSSDDGLRDYEENRAYLGIAWSRRGS